MRALFLILVLWPMASSSETADLRTGWHPTFTRIVVSIPTGAEWQLGRTNDGFGFRADGIDDFDTRGFFTRLPLDRISDARSQDATLELSLTCDCHADAFLWQPDKVVVDILDGSPPADNAYEVSLVIPDAEPMAIASAPPVELDLLPKPKTRVSLSYISPIGEVEPEQTDLAEIEARIIDGLTRAADQGLLTLSSPVDVILNEEEAVPELEVPTVEKVETARTPESVLPPRSGVEARTSIDLGIDLSELLQPGRTNGIDCWPDSYVQFDDWANGENFSEITGSLRARVYGEFDRIDHAAVTDLARAYLYFGFGREAAQILKIDGEKTAERAAIAALAQIIDGDEGDLSAVTAQIGCPGQVALWAVLATPVDSIDSVNDPDRLVRQFKTLPDQLRAHLAPKFATRLAAIGQSDTAENLLSSTPETSGTGVEEAIVVAEIATKRGDFETAEATLSGLAARDRDVTPEALIDLITIQMGQRKSIDPEMIALLETKRFEYRDADVADRLAEVHLRSQVYQDQFNAALENLRESFPVVTAPDYQELLAHIFDNVAERAEDISFLEFAYTEEAVAVAPASGNKVAERLLEIGFPNRASEILASSAEGEVMAERRYLRASASMKMGQIEEAQEELAGIGTNRAAGILALPTDTKVGDPSSAWRNGDWSSLAETEDVLLQTASSLAREQIDPTPDPTTPLRQGQDLIEQAAATRETVDELLARFAEPDVD